MTATVVLPTAAVALSLRGIDVHNGSVDGVVVISEGIVLVPALACAGIFFRRIVGIVVFRRTGKEHENKRNHKEKSK